ncbi:Thermoresistant gluconokinase [compost metagenome]
MKSKFTAHSTISPDATPAAIVVMGVAGCGKSSIASAFARHLKGVLIEGDSFHSLENIEKMRKGIALTDQDRATWLTQLNDELRSAVAAGKLPILACSALKASYRARLESDLGTLATVFLDLSRSEAEKRVSLRTDHYMPPSLVSSQFTDLEPPADSKNAITVDATLPPAEILHSLTLWWNTRVH